jgi:glucose-1-phosphate cytidylyltransferase
MVNGGFYVFQRKALEYLSEDRSCILEKKPLEQMALHGQLMGFRHEGYWQCMDTTRDLESLQQSWIDGKAPWKVWKDGQAD